MTCHRQARFGEAPRALAEHEVEAGRLPRGETSVTRHRRAFTLALLAATSAGAQRRVPFEFDGGLARNPTQTQQRRAALESALPSWQQLPSSLETLESAPAGVTPPTTTLWFFPEVKAQFLRAADAGVTPMAWPAPTFCARTASFTAPTTTLLAPGASVTCQMREASVRQALTLANLSTCLEQEEPERYVTASRVPAGLSQSALNSFVDQRTGTFEQQVALAGAAFSLVPMRAGVLPADWVPTMRSILWKVRGVDTSRVAATRAAFQSASTTLSTDAPCFDATRGPQLRADLQAMAAELTALEAHVAQVVAQGTSTAAQQRQCLLNRGRTRPALPVPSLTDEERRFIAFWLGGVYWRMRGAGLLQLGSTQNARTFFMRRPFREIARLSNGTAVGERAADALYCGLFDGWGSWMDMGTYMNPSAPAEDNQDMYDDLVGMTNRGREQVAARTTATLPCYLLNVSGNKHAEEQLRDANYDTQALFAGGLQMGPCYLYSLNPLGTFSWYTSAQAQPPYSGFLEGFTALGEFCTGAALGLGLTTSLLNGTPTGQPPTSACGARQCGVDVCGVSCGTCAAGLSCDASGQCAMAGAGGGAAGGASGGVAGGTSGGVAGGTSGGVAGGTSGGIAGGTSGGVAGGTSGGIAGGTSGGIAGGTSGGVAGGTSGGVAGGASGGVAGGASGGVAGGASGGIAGGASGGVAGGTSGGVAGGTSGGIAGGASGGVAGGTSGGIAGGDAGPPRTSGCGCTSTGPGVLWLALAVLASSLTRRSRPEATPERPRPACH